MILVFGIIEPGFLNQVPTLRTRLAGVLSGTRVRREKEGLGFEA